MCMHFFPAHSEKQSEPFYKVLSRPVTKQPYCTAQNHVGMGWGSKTKVSCAVSRKCFSVSRCFTQRPSKTSPPRPGHHPAQHVVAPYTIPLPDFSAALWTALCPATCAALRTRTLSNFTTALVVNPMALGENRLSPKTGCSNLWHFMAMKSWGTSWIEVPKCGKALRLPKVMSTVSRTGNPTFRKSSGYTNI